MRNYLTLKQQAVLCHKIELKTQYSFLYINDLSDCKTVYLTRILKKYNAWVGKGLMRSRTFSLYALHDFS